MLQTFLMRVGARCRPLLMLAVFVGVVPQAQSAPAETLETSEQPPVPCEHFPSRLHAVVWRNWTLVPAERLAQVVGATEAQIRATAASLGLPAEAQAEDAELWKRRGYITLVRRNWHLLPYEQLLELLEMDADELAFALREDDFLWIKLGGSKPRCSPVRWREPDAATERRCAQFRRWIDEEGGGLLDQPAEPRFAFISQLSSTADAPPAPQDAAERLQAPPRFIYSYFGTFGDPLIDSSQDPYPEGLLARLADQGVNGVWLHVVLRQLAPGGESFPEFGDGHKPRLENLRRMTQRAAKYGIRVYLYINEPRAMPVGFFAEREALRGAPAGNYATMCTSTPEVRKWLQDSLAHVFREVPELGGAFTITASENLTSCASHGRKDDCPRCRERSAAEIIGEVNQVIEAGVHQGNPQARVFAWDWGWNGHGQAEDHIAQLPKAAWLMSVSEWALPIRRGGVDLRVGEYSLSAVGPGPRATAHWSAARQRGLSTLAKVQVNNTWELSAVPYLPVMDLVAEHFHNLSQQRVDGVMLSWSLGGYPSPNLRLAQAFLENPQLAREEALSRLASDLYGAAAGEMRHAWTDFSEAFREFPYHGAVLYRGPQNYGPANLLYAEPTGRPSTMLGFPYDDLDGWRGVYPSQVFIDQFDALANRWRKGTDRLRKVAPQSPAAEEQLVLAEAALAHFESSREQARFVLARQQGDRPAMQAALRREIELAKRLYTLTKRDSRIGFEASNHYYYVPHDLLEKIANCRDLLDTLSK